ncbi:MAG: helix-turn-helix domain-containing protein [Lachnospiraceae bacterium]
MDQIKIGILISELRKEKHLTQEQLGEKLGVSQKSISRWETGRNMPDISLLKPLSVELGITVSELIEGERSELLNNEKENCIDEMIEYTTQARKNNSTLWNDVNFITTVISVLAVILLVIGVAEQHLMIPTMVLCLLLVIVIVRIVFCKCPGCGKTLPYFLGKAKVCPHCGLKISREEK